jgi:hypothetical protein
MTTLRRFLVFQSLLAWQGGFFFYAVVVVPVGTRILESAALQGAITQSVSNWLNAFGVVSLGLLAWDQVAVPHRRTGRWYTWSVMAACHVALIALHPYLDSHFDPADLTYGDRPTFKFWHGIYLWAIGLQWFAGLASAWLTLSAWHRPSKGAP